MLSEKQFVTESNNLIKLNEISQKILKKRTEKVTVQYIQEQQKLIQKPENHSKIHQMAPNHRTSQDDLEIESVEYLEENPTEEFIDEPASKKDDFEDTFYPNAIHCLLDLYKIKYESMLSMSECGDLKVSQLWHDIAKEMQESYFEFNDQQVRRKYILLKEQYFGLNSKESIENFDYFEQLHNIYKDPAKDNLLKGLQAYENGSTYVKDEVLLNVLEFEKNDLQHDFKSKEIVHKEHEFINMVEKELQAMEGGVQVEENQETISKSTKGSGQLTIANEKYKKEIDKDLEQNQIDLKRSALNDEELITEPPAKRKSNLNNYIEISKIADKPLDESSIFTPNKDISISQYNEHQERRHREQINLLEKNVRLQEQAIAQQKQILEELLKRLPS